MARRGGSRSATPKPPRPQNIGFPGYPHPNISRVFLKCLFSRNPHRDDCLLLLECFCSHSPETARSCQLGCPQPMCGRLSAARPASRGGWRPGRAARAVPNDVLVVLEGRRGHDLKPRPPEPTAPPLCPRRCTHCDRSHKRAESAARAVASQGRTRKTA